MPRKIAAAALIALAVGCATQKRWAPHGTPRAPLAQADATCRAQYLGALNVQNPTGVALAIARYKTCMRGFGWVQVEVE